MSTLTPFMIVPPKVVELEKEAAVRDDARIIGNFLEWLQENRGGDEIADINVQKVMYEYFDVDADKCENERRQLLAYQRMLHAMSATFKELGIENPTQSTGGT